MGSVAGLAGGALGCVFGMAIRSEPQLKQLWAEILFYLGAADLPVSGLLLCQRSLRRDETERRPIGACGHTPKDRVGPIDLAIVQMPVA